MRVQHVQHADPATHPRGGDRAEGPPASLKLVDSKTNPPHLDAPHERHQLTQLTGAPRPEMGAGAPHHPQRDTHIAAP